MKNKIFIALIILIILISSCKDDPVRPIENEDIVPQIDIDWPSLARTSWPMFHHDPQSTGRSKYLGPQNGEIEHIKFDNCEMTMSGISIGYDNTVFLPSGDMSNSFFAFDFNGNIKWERFLSSTSTPLISTDSSIYIPTINNSIIALNNNGDTLWIKEIDKMYNIGINIDKKGNIYFIDMNGYNPNSEGVLKVIKPDGQLYWKLNDSRILPTPDAAPSFSPDGKTLYVQGITVSILAIDIETQKIKWTFGDKTLRSSPVIDNAGNIYIIPGDISFPQNRNLISLNQNGQINWEFNFDCNHLWNNTPPTIDYKGNIYFGGDSLFSVTNGGKYRWKKYLNGGRIITPLVCDINNNIFLGTDNVEQIYAFSCDGELKWRINNLDFRTIGNCPAISDNGIMFLPSWRNSQISLSIIK